MRTFNPILFQRAARCCALLCLALGILFPLPVVAQTDTMDIHRVSMRSTMVGVGEGNVFDTYLSPLEYVGPQFTLAHESMRSTKWLQGRISTSDWLEANFMNGERTGYSGQQMAGGLVWHKTWHYNWKPAEGLTLLAGAGLRTHAGFVYNRRNSNNPAQAKLSLQTVASGMAVYRLPFQHFPYTLRYAVALPFAGLHFSPHYTQSYYELFQQDNYDHNVCPSWVGNAPSMYHLFTADIPLGGFVLRLGYEGAYSQTHLNGLKYHHYSNTFLLGWVRHLYRIHPKDKKNKQWIL